MTRAVLESVESEFRKYKKLAESAISQLGDDDLLRAASAHDNSIVVIAWHISGNLTSRFADFLTTDGEKPWRQRDEEFVRRRVTRAEMLEKWERGWTVLFETLATLSDADLTHTVHIRTEPVAVFGALHRALAHVSYHVGQIVLIAKTAKGGAWQSLSIPRGQSETWRLK